MTANLFFDHYVSFFLGDLKRICETDLGLISQCCLTKHVFKTGRQYLANVSLKINVKVSAALHSLILSLEESVSYVLQKFQAA